MKKFLAVSLLSLLMFAGISSFSTSPVSAGRLKRFKVVFRCFGGRRVVIRVRTHRYRSHAIEFARRRARNRGCIRPHLIRAVRVY